MSQTSSKIIVAIDSHDEKTARMMVATLDPHLCRLKIGKGLFTQCGPSLVSAFQKEGFDVFLDLKFHDIPNTVAAAIRAAADLGVWMLTVHASGGPTMLDAAYQAQSQLSKPPLIVAVTVLTSMDASQLKALGFSISITTLVQKLTAITAQSGLNGVVCSAQEAQIVKSAAASSFLTVCPGIRLPHSIADDQSRTMTPSEAIRAGADYLVIGRPITQSKHPLATLQQLHQQMHIPHTC